MEYLNNINPYLSGKFVENTLMEDGKELIKWSFLDDNGVTKTVYLDLASAAEVIDGLQNALVAMNDELEESYAETDFYKDLWVRGEIMKN